MFLSSGDHLKTQKSQEVHNLNSDVPSNFSTLQWWWFPELQIKGMKFLLFQHSDPRKNMVAKGWFSPVESVAIFALSRAGRLGKETLLRVPQLEGRVKFLCALLHLPTREHEVRIPQRKYYVGIYRQKQKRFMYCVSRFSLWPLEHIKWRHSWRWPMLFFVHSDKKLGTLVLPLDLKNEFDHRDCINTDC